MTKKIGCLIFEHFGQLSQVKSHCDPLKRMSTSNTELDVYQPPNADLQAQRQRQLDAGFSKNLGKCHQSQNPKEFYVKTQMRQMRIVISFTGIALPPKIDVKRIFLTKSYMIILEQ